MEIKTQTDGTRYFVAFGNYFYHGFGGWQMFKCNAIKNSNVTGFKLKKDAVNYARKNPATPL